MRNGVAGGPFAFVFFAMKLSDHPHDSRRKAVWGSKRTVRVLMFLILRFTPQVIASGAHPHSQQPGKVKPGVAGKKAQHTKLDHELTGRADAKKQNPNDFTSVIVTLQKNAKLPAQFKQYVRGGKLNLINAHVVNLPNRLLKQLSAHPDVFDVHFNRPIHKHNYRTSLTIGALAVQRAFGLTGAGGG